MLTCSCSALCIVKYIFDKSSSICPSISPLIHLSLILFIWIHPCVLFSNGTKKQYRHVYLLSIQCHVIFSNISSLLNGKCRQTYLTLTLMLKSDHIFWPRPFIFCGGRRNMPDSPILGNTNLSFSWKLHSKVSYTNVHHA